MVRHTQPDGFNLPRWAAVVALAGLCAALASCAWLDTKQRQLALRPTPAVNASFDGLRPGDVVLNRETAGSDGAAERVQLWWLPHPDGQAPALLYLHGTFRNLFQNLPKIDALREAGFAIVAVDYRGWGESTPIVPTEQSIYDDARLAWHELEKRQPDPCRRVIYGHSLGGAVAVDLASQLRFGTDYGALILESTFTSVPDVSAAAGFWGQLGAMLTTLSFDSRSKIGKVDAPILMLHGELDRTVPIELGRQLRDVAPADTRWIEIAGGPHSRLHSYAPQAYQQAMHELIEQVRRNSASTGGGRCASSGK
jgi:pimeloyl-ACP methyl ester carboxylesterase